MFDVAEKSYFFVEIRIKGVEFGENQISKSLQAEV